MSRGSALAIRLRRLPSSRRSCEVHPIQRVFISLNVIPTPAVVYAVGPGFSQPSRTTLSSYLALALLLARSKERLTSNAPRGIISASYASMASSRVLVPAHTWLKASTISLTSFRALFKPCPRSVKGQFRQLEMGQHPHEASSHVRHRQRGSIGRHGCPNWPCRD
jgi:hypothetical protein